MLATFGLFITTMIGISDTYAALVDVDFLVGVDLQLFERVH